MGFAKHIFWESKNKLAEDYFEEAQSRACMSMLCKATQRPLNYPLLPRIVEFVRLFTMK